MMVGAHPAIGKQLTGHVDGSSIVVDIQMTLVTPADARTRVPVMMMFGSGSLAPPAGRGAPPAGSDPPATEQLIAAGWGYASISPASIQADNGAGLTKGIIGLVNKGQPRTPDDWGALRAWAWGASRGLDYLETDAAVDAKRVGIEGVSRFGKAALVTMAFDHPVRGRARRVVGRRRRQAPSPQLGRSRRKPHRSRRVPLDGRQLPEVRSRRSRPSAAGTPATCRSMRTN